MTVHHNVDPNNRYQILDQEIFTHLGQQWKKNQEINLNIPKEKFAYCKVPFLYDARDYYYLPGLYRSSGDGYLTPVFFNKEVLLKYTHHPDYAVDLASETYGAIFMKHGSFISFGINRSSRIIFWLGDVDRLSEPEQYYLRSENIQSDHDVASQFYEAQIEVSSPTLSKERALLRARHDMENHVFDKLKIKLTQLDLEQAPVLKKITRPIVWDENHVGAVIERLNKVLVESINTRLIRQDILRVDHTFNANELKGLKLMQTWLEKRCGLLQPGALLRPLFVLYDLRVVFSHLLSTVEKNKKLRKVCTRLGLSLESNKDLKAIYDALIGALKGMYEEIDSKIASLQFSIG